MAYDIVKKIQTLVAKAESTESASEAESIMVKVRDLLDRHGISLLTVARYANEYDPVGTSRDVYGFWAADNWMRKLSDAAGAYYGVRVIWTKVGNFTQIAVVGRESCRAAYTAMLPYLRGQVRRLANRGWAYHAYPTESKGRTQIGIALAYRLYALAKAKEEQAAAQNPPTPTAHKVVAGLNMLVPVDEIEIELAETFPHLRKVKVRTKARPSPAAIRDAARVNLADQLREQGAPNFVLGESK